MTILATNRSIPLGRVHAMQALRITTGRCRDGQCQRHLRTMSTAPVLALQGLRDGADFHGGLNCAFSCQAGCTRLAAPGGVEAGGNRRHTAAAIVIRVMPGSTRRPLDGVRRIARSPQGPTACQATPQAAGQADNRRFHQALQDRSSAAHRARGARPVRLPAAELGQHQATRR